MPRTPSPARPPKRRSDRTTDNPNHHLWQHGKNWWVYCAVNPTPRTKDKLRRSLCTEHVESARLRRDELFRRLHAEGMLGRIRALPPADTKGLRAPEPVTTHLTWKQRIDAALAAAIAMTPEPKTFPAPVVGAGEGKLRLCYS